jgi:hypothetical protein
MLMQVEQEPKQTDLKQLERREKQLRLKMWRQKRRPSRIVGYSLLLIGVFSLFLSIFYSAYSSSLIVALIGLGLTFWGVLLLYITPVKFVSSSLLDSTVISSLANISKMLKELNYKGNGIYLPPTYIGGVKGGIVYIPSKKSSKIPSIEEVAEEKVFLNNPNGICLTPPGLALTNLYEEELGKDFARTDLTYLQNNLPKVIIEGLEIAENMDIKAQNNRVQVMVKGNIYQDLCKKIHSSPNNICSSVGCPLCSSIALSLARATGRPVTIEDSKTSEDGKTVETKFKLLEGQKLEKRTEPSVETPPSPPLPSRATETILTLSGAAILVLVSWIIISDILVWNKSISTILFASRIGEAVSLGIGLNIFYYLAAGLILLTAGLTILILSRGRR